MDHLDPGQARESGSELRGHGKRTQAGVEHGWDRLRDLWQQEASQEKAL